MVRTNAKGLTQLLRVIDVDYGVGSVGIVLEDDEEDIGGSI